MLDNLIPEHRKNRNPHKTGLMFDQREKEKIAGKRMRMESIHSCEAVKESDENDFQGNLTIMKESAKKKSLVGIRSYANSGKP